MYKIRHYLLLLCFCSLWFVPEQGVAQTKFSLDTNTIDRTPSFAHQLPYVEILGYVVCQADFPLSETGELREEINQLQRDLILYLGIPQPREKIELCLFKDMNSYRQFLTTQFKDIPLDRPALYIKDNGPGILMVPRDKNMMVNVRHEMTHAFLNSTLQNVPIWLDEGLAKYFETPAGKRGYENPFLKTVKKKNAWSFGVAPSLPRLEKLQNINQMGEREYRESWSWVHFLIHYSSETHQLLGVYLKSLTPERQAGISGQEAIQRQREAPLTQLLQKHLPDYKKKYVEHFKKWEPPR